jgi:alpha-L-rhamnosidase
MGSIDGWFYRTLAGIQPDEAQPGFRHFIIKPFIPDALSHVSAGIQALPGRIAVEWKKESGTLRMVVSVPANTAATVYMPRRELREVTTKPALAPPVSGNGSAVYEVDSGTYEFVTAWP